MRLWLLAGLMLLMSVTGYATEAEEIWSELPLEEMEQIASEADLSLRNMATQLISGQAGDLNQWTQRLIASAREAFLQSWRQVLGVLMCVCVCEMVKAISAGRSRVHSALELLCRIAVALPLLVLSVDAFRTAEQICSSLQRFTGAAAPALAAVLTLTGSAGMSAAMPGLAVMADQLTIWISTDIGLPALKSVCALAVCSGLSNHFRLERLFKTLIGAVKWLLGCSMTGFLALLSTQSVLVGSRDGIAVRTTQYAVDNLLPIIGGELADTIGSVFASAALVKNALGIAVCAVLVGMVLTPLVRMAIIVLMLKIASAAVDLMGIQGAAPMIDRICQMLEALMALMASVAVLGILLAGATVMAAGARG